MKARRGAGRGVCPGRRRFSPQRLQAGEAPSEALVVSRPVGGVLSSSKTSVELEPGRGVGGSLTSGSLVQGVRSGPRRPANTRCVRGTAAGRSRRCLTRCVRPLVGPRAPTRTPGGRHRQRTNPRRLRRVLGSCSRSHDPHQRGRPGILRRFNLALQRRGSDCCPKSSAGLPGCCAGKYRA